MDKREVVEWARARFRQQIDELENHIRTVQQSANAESKSSMGDKYETGRAMAQNEVFLLSSQLENQKREFGKFEATDFVTVRPECGAGSLVQTASAWFLLSAGLGKVTVAGGTVMCISLDSPLGQALLGKQAGEEFSVNGQENRVLNVR